MAIPPVIIAGNSQADIAEYVTSMSVDLTLAQMSQISIRVFDPNLQMLEANYFQMRQSVQYLGMNYEISALEVGPAAGGAQITLTCRPAATQTLKREKITNISTVTDSTSYARGKAASVGLAFFGENSPARKNITASTESDSSSWDTMSTLAGEAGFILFEIDGRLFFCSQPYLLGKFGLDGYGLNEGFSSIPIRWRSPQIGSSVRYAPAISGPPDLPPLKITDGGANTVASIAVMRPAIAYLQKVLILRAGQTITDLEGRFGTSTETAVKNLQTFFGIQGNLGKVGSMTWSIVNFLAEGIQFVSANSGMRYLSPLEIPTARKSENATDGAEVSFRLDRSEGKSVRPGMTISLEDIPGFTGYYLVQSVSWEEGTPDPVSVSATTLIEPLPDSATNNEALNRFRASLSFNNGGLNYSTVNTNFGGSG
jgi:hypothetical protein